MQNKTKQSNASLLVYGRLSVRFGVLTPIAVQVITQLDSEQQNITLQYETSNLADNQGHSLPGGLQPPELSSVYFKGFHRFLWLHWAVVKQNDK